MIYPGSDIVTFFHDAGDGVKDHLGIPAPNPQPPSGTDQRGCSVQPMGVKDDVGNTEFSSATHKIIAPATDLVLACKAEDKVRFKGITMRVVGKRVFLDRRANVHHVDVIAKEEHG